MKRKRKTAKRGKMSKAQIDAILAKIARDLRSR
jgi:hypothetical protein